MVGEFVINSSMPRHLRAKILVLSDRAARAERADRSGEAVRQVLERAGWSVGPVEILPDELDQIRLRLVGLTDADDCEVVFTTGGTGLASRDVTPEATRAILEKEAPGLAELMRAEGVKKTRLAALSRGICGARKGKLIVNLPGSVRGATESLESILDLLPHAIELLKGKTEHTE